MELRCNNVSAFFGRHQVLNSVSLTAKAGELCAIVGPNGCGKTTLLRTMTGEIPYEGVISLNGADILGASPQEMAAQRGVLPQTTNLAFPFTVLEVVRIGLTAGVATATVRSHAQLPSAALARVGLAGFEGRFYQELSGGEKQRVQLARVLVQIWDPVLKGTPRWLFLDEPVSALDIAHQLMVMNIARDFARAGGGVVAVMHDLNLTAMYADQIALMSDGKMTQAGRPKDVLQNSALSAAYHCGVRVNALPAQDTPWVLPQAAIASPTRPQSPGDMQ